MTASTPRRALFLVGRDPSHPRAAGGDLQAWQWARRLADQGWRVQYICMSAPGLAREERRDGITIRRLGAGIGLATRAFAHSLRTGPYDLVYEDPIGAGRVPYLSPLFTRSGHIAVWHQASGPLVASLRGPVAGAVIASIERVLALAYRRSLLWVPSGERKREISTELGISPSRMIVIPPTLGENVRISKDARRDGGSDFVCLGVMRSYKAFEHAISALAIVRRARPEARLVVAGRHGDSDYERRLRATIDEHGLDDAVSFEFDISDERRAELLRGSCALVVPSVLEGFGIVSIEANAVATPVIASSGVPEAAVEDGVNGLTFEFGDVQALADRMVALLVDPPLRHRLAAASLDHARSLTPEAVGGRFDLLVASALKRHRTVHDPIARKADNYA